MQIKIIIPARYDSTRFPGKALADILGKPMICRVAERAAQAKGIDEVLVATDDERIAAAVKKAGFKAVMTSPDAPSGTDRIAEACRDIDADLIVDVQGDEPLLNPEMVEEAVAPFLNDEELMMSTLKFPIENREDYLDPNLAKVVTDKDDFALYFSRSPIPHIKDTDDLKVPNGVFGHVGLYVYRRDFLLKLAELKPTFLEKVERLEQLRVLENGYRIKAITTKHKSLGVDTPEDLEKVIKILNSKKGQVA